MYVLSSPIEDDNCVLLRLFESSTATSHQTWTDVLACIIAKQSLAGVETVGANGRFVRE